MAGHNKWKQIKHKKAVTDGKKSKSFSLLSKMITVEAKRVGGNTNDPNLRSLLERARAINMPNDNINRAIERAISNANTVEEVLYEGYGPGGLALILEGVTDSKNRTTQEIKFLLKDHRGSLSTANSVLWAFTKGSDGYQPVSKISLSEADKLTTLALIEALAEHDDIKTIYTNAYDF